MIRLDTIGEHYQKLSVFQKEEIYRFFVCVQIQ